MPLPGARVNDVGAIASTWSGVPNNVDGSVEHSSGRYYFFKGDKYYRYVPGQGVDKVALISSGWKGVPNNIDAVLLHANGKYYFFKGDKYYRYITGSGVDKSGSISSGWSRLRLADTISRNEMCKTRSSTRAMTFSVSIGHVTHSRRGKRKLAPARRWRQRLD